ncbi:hypothetical protein BC835DRAFT_1417854 [Cytidiella melzeri]|nr:hypothetical protein BC835DRAFT_1417854 [Cytidiella melzeri]
MPTKGTRSSLTGGSAKPTPTTPAAASRIQSTQATAGKDTGKGSFPARVQSAAQRNTNAATTTPAAAPKAAKGSQK